MVSIFLGIMVATLLMSAAPVYLDALERQSINSAVETSLARDGETYFTITTRSNFIPLEVPEIERTGAALDQAIDASVAPIHTGTQRHLRTPFYSVVLPDKPMTSSSRHSRESGNPGSGSPTGNLGEDETDDDEPPPPPEPAEGLIQSYTGLDDHITIVDGRSAQDTVLRGTQGPMVEVLVSASTSAEFGGLVPGDVLVVAPSQDSPVKVSARIAGLIAATDPEDPYWQRDVESFLFPRVPNSEGEVTPNSPPALGMFVSQPVLAGTVGTAFPGAAVNSTWYSGVDATVLRGWSKAEMRGRMELLKEELSILLPGSFAFSGIDIMLVRFGRRSFLSSVPLLLLLTVLGVAVLYFLFMIVSYLVPNRESDVALFRSRGTSTWRLLKLYLGEGAILALVAAAIAPFLALLVVWLAGLLPYFEHITGGRPLPVHPSWIPFAAAAIAGLLCLIIFVVPGVLGARAGLIIHRLRASRPPSMPLMQRFYIDIGFLVVGGILFWELQARGELVSGSLFGEQDVNEALLLAPVLFLIAVGLMFFRVFPMFIRYVSGESLGLVHLATAITLPVLTAAIAFDYVRAGDPAGWLPQATAIALFAAAYWLSTSTAPSPFDRGRYLINRRSGEEPAPDVIRGRNPESGDERPIGLPTPSPLHPTRHSRERTSPRTPIRGGNPGAGRLSLLTPLHSLLSFVVQIAAIAWFTYQSPPHPDQPAAIFVGSIALLCLVPAQLLFYQLAEFARRAPVWVSMSMWHMARNPLQYSWLVLLLVLAGGIGVLSTTVGATLDRSYDERVRYNVGADIRVVELDSYLGRRDGRVGETFGAVPGVQSISVAHRSTGRIGAGSIGSGFSFLAVDTNTFDAWYRDDFSEQSLGQVLSTLKADEPVRPIELPEGARKIQMWVNPESFYPLIFLWIVLEDANGLTDTVTFGDMPDPGWHLVTADVPDGLAHPIKVVSIQLNEPGFGATATAGSVVFDDLMAVSQFGAVTLVEGFEPQARPGEDSFDWIPIATSQLGADQVNWVSDNTRSGSGAAQFRFGKETNVGIRGIYQVGGHGYIPAVASRTFSAATGAGVNNALLVNLPGGVVPVVVTGIVDYFPTLDPARGGFLVFDIDTLLAYMDALNPLGETSVNEIFIHAEPGTDSEVLQAVSRMVRARGGAIGLEDQLAAQDVDPLISAGWRTIVLVALGVILFISGLGYVVYLLAFAERSMGEMGSLRSLGFSRIQTIGLIGLEHILVALIGLGVGTWAGFQMSRMMVSSVAVTDSGGRVLPPFILTTNWLLMGPLYVVLVAIFITALLTFGGRVLSIDLRRLSRMEN